MAENKRGNESPSGARRHTRSLLRELAVERDLHGHPRELDLALGKWPGYMSNFFAGRTKARMPLVIEALHHLGVEPIEHFARALGRSVRCQPEALLKRLEEPSAGSPVLDRFETMASERTIAPSAESGDPALGRLRSALKDIDELRFCDAHEAFRQAEVLLATGMPPADEARTPRLACFVLGVFAAAAREVGHRGLAARSLRMALELAKREGWAAEHADLLCRACYLLGHEGELEAAINVARQAAKLSVLYKDLHGVGTALVARARVHVVQRDHAEATRAFRAALEYLAPSDWRHEFTAHHGLAWIHMTQGHLEEATKAAARAAEVHKTRSGQSWCRLEWLRGEIALKRGDLATAEAALLRTRETFAETGNAVDLALVSLRLAQTYLLAGKAGELRHLARDMLTLLTPLRGNRIARAALQEFLGAAITSEITEDLVERACAQIRGGAAQRS